MGKRKIVKIDESKCTGCGLCIPKCAEGALQIINGKAKLMSDKYCDGLGACLGECPEGAITIIERNAEEFNEEAVKKHLKKEHPHDEQMEVAMRHHQCPSSQAITFTREETNKNVNTQVPSALAHWPVKIQLVASNAPFFNNADIVVAADCAPFAYGNFHNDFMKDKIVIIGCPKLNDSELYFNKITSILRENNVKSITVAHMEVPCCFGLDNIVSMAIKASGKLVKKNKVIIGIKGNIVQD